MTRRGRGEGTHVTTTHETRRPAGGGAGRGPGPRAGGGGAELRAVRQGPLPAVAEVPSRRAAEDQVQVRLPAAGLRLLQPAALRLLPGLLAPLAVPAGLVALPRAAARRPGPGTRP